MDIQTIIVAIIILGAAVYVGQAIWQKAKSAAKNSTACAADCGCDAKKITN
ncbi:MAG: FeoB-associated Cys-rich membrane protein [Acidobacteriota bacterium]|nr:FeoB-associated Cys-rich membrane protein [Acidobacteriota bacterium]